jgi:hypothetical protein
VNIGIALSALVAGFGGGIHGELQRGRRRVEVMVIRTTAVWLSPQQSIQPSRCLQRDGRLFQAIAGAW